MIDLHFAPAPNSLKVIIALEEMGMPYRVIQYDLYKGTHLEPAFRAISPSLKLPTIVDHAPADGGEPFSVFESGAILQYLAEKGAQLLPTDMRRRSEAIQWVTWQVAGLGPYMGQAGHFLRYAPPGDHSYPVKRYVAESQRLVQVLDNRLKRAPYLAGEEYSIADIASWPVAKIFSPYLGIDLDAFPHVTRWSEAISSRPAVQKSLGSPAMTTGRHTQSKPELTAEEWSMSFGDKMLNAVKED